jgi:membrane protease YdiL (CAAX protease family)
VLNAPQGNPAYLALNSVVLFLPTVTALLFMARFGDQTPVTAFGFAIHDHWLKDFAVGIAIAAGMLSLTVAGSVMFGEVHMTWSGSSGAISGFALTFAALALSALCEELVFRGYPLQILMKGLGPWSSMILISFLFGLLHSRNPGANLLSILGTVLAGVALAVAYVRTRSVWLPYGIHLGWNVGLSMVLGYPMSGIRTVSILKTDVSGSQVLLGGDYGPEAGLVGMVVFAGAAAVIYRLRVLKVSPQVRAAIVAHPENLYVGDL